MSTNKDIYPMSNSSEGTKNVFVTHLLLFFFTETFIPVIFSLRHFRLVTETFPSVVCCFTVVLKVKLAIKVFSRLSFFKHSDRNHLILFGHVENRSPSVYDQKKTDLL